MTCIQEDHRPPLKDLKAFGEEHPGSRRIVVANEPIRRISDDIEIIAVYDFLQELWKGSIFTGH